MKTLRKIRHIAKTNKCDVRFNMKPKNNGIISITFTPQHKPIKLDMRRIL